MSEPSHPDCGSARNVTNFSNIGASEISAASGGRDVPSGVVQAILETH